LVGAGIVVALSILCGWKVVMLLSCMASMFSISRYYTGIFMMSS